MKSKAASIAFMNSTPRPLRCRSYHKAVSASSTEASVSVRRRSISASSEVELSDCGHPPKIPLQSHRIKRDEHVVRSQRPMPLLPPPDFPSSRRDWPATLLRNRRVHAVELARLIGQQWIPPLSTAVAFWS